MNEEKAKSNNPDEIENENQEEVQTPAVDDATPEEVPVAEKEIKISAEVAEQEKVNDSETKPPAVAEEEESSAEPIEPETVPEPEVEIPGAEKKAKAPQEISTSDQESKPVDESPKSELETPEKTSRPEYVSRGQAFWMSAGCSSLALFLALVIGLAVLAGLNRGNLVFASPAQISKLALDVDRINKVVNGIEQDLNSVQNRVDNLEALSGRLNEIEQTLEDINKEMETVTAQVADMDQKVQDLSQQAEILATNVESLQADSARYQGFLNGLQELLGEVLTPQEESK